MGGKSSKPTTCNRCGVTGPVSDKQEFKGLCERCIRRDIEAEEQELARQRDLDEIERQRREHELENNKMVAKIELKEREARLEAEKIQKKYELERQAAMDRINQMKLENENAYQKAKQLDEAERNEIERKLKEQMAELEVREKDIQIQHEKSVKDAELEADRKFKELELELQEKREKQARKFAEEDHKLNQLLKKDQQKFQQQLDTHTTMARLDMEKDFNKRVKIRAAFQTDDGRKIDMNVTEGASHELLAAFSSAFGGISPIKSEPKPEAIENTKQQATESQSSAPPVQE